MTGCTGRAGGSDWTNQTASRERNGYTRRDCTKVRRNSGDGSRVFCVSDDISVVRLFFGYGSRARCAREDLVHMLDLDYKRACVLCVCARCALCCGVCLVRVRVDFSEKRSLNTHDRFLHRFTSTLAATAVYMGERGCTCFAEPISVCVYVCALSPGSSHL